LKGYPAHKMEEMTSANLPDDDETYLCWGCVGEEFLQGRIRKEGSRAKCSFCEKTRKALAIEELGNIFELAFESHFRRTRPGMTELEEAQMRHGLLDWPPDRDGEPVIEVLKSTAKISQEVAEAIRVELEGRFGTRDDYEMQNETEFDSDSYYEEMDGTAGDWHEQWAAFEKELRENSRYFSNEALAILRRVFDGICDFRTQNGGSVIAEAGPGTPIDALVRARVFPDREKMAKALQHPDTEIGPPPSRLAKAGRMNPGGISTFYGSLDKKAAVSEVRPAVGSPVVIGKFVLVRGLRLLDLTSLGEVRLPGSVFDPEYKRRLERE
jgi:RES domain